MKNRFFSIYAFVAVSSFTLVGCNSVGDTFTDPIAGMQDKVEDPAFRKTVENDPFPTAVQAGVMVAGK